MSPTDQRSRIIDDDPPCSRVHAACPLRVASPALERWVIRANRPERACSTLSNGLSHQKSALEARFTNLELHDPALKHWASNPKRASRVNATKAGASHPFQPRADPG